MPRLAPYAWFWFSTTLLLKMLKTSSEPFSWTPRTVNNFRKLMSSWFSRSRYSVPGGMSGTVTDCVRPAGRGKTEAAGVQVTVSGLPAKLWKLALTWTSYFSV